MAVGNWYDLCLQTQVIHLHTHTHTHTRALRVRRAPEGFHLLTVAGQSTGHVESVASRRSGRSNPSGSVFKDGAIPPPGGAQPTSQTTAGLQHKHLQTRSSFRPSFRHWPHVRMPVHVSPWSPGRSCRDRTTLPSLRCPLRGRQPFSFAAATETGRSQTDLR